MSDLAKRLGKRIYGFRKQKGLTQGAVAEKARISPEFMSGIERGAKLPSLPTLERIAGVLGVGLKDLFNFDQAGFKGIQKLSREALDIALMVELLDSKKRQRIAKVVKLLTTTKL